MSRPMPRTRRRLTILVEDRGAGSSTGCGLVAETIIELAREQGLPGISAFRGDAGYGPDGPVDGRPVMIVAVGDAECLDDFAHAVATALPDGLVVLDDVVELVLAARVAAHGSDDPVEMAPPVAAAGT
ncbi:DUF190 domain-containing protein [Pseudonocardia sp. CA-107938]|uniref:DUF190 domain-containing protein n=1 Tax=Pseudonocardia sp. CA-107938 TaxID=3240021 RepID=UPI003D9200A4